jgi:O-methyltransferase
VERTIPWLGWHLRLTRQPPPPPGIDAARGFYNADCLSVTNRNLDALVSPRFTAAYKAGMDTGHKIGRAAGSAADVHIEWRTYVCCWAAEHALKLDGDFVECGVNTGIYSKAICEYLGFGDLDRRMFLFDTFQGIPPEQMSDNERKARTAENRDFYEDCHGTAVKNFAAYPNVTIVKGRVPDTLTDVDIERVAYLSIDMNIAAPEVAALEYFWDRLVPGALVVLDDYGWSNYRPQYDAMNTLAARLGVSILTMPTGQGLIVRPSPSARWNGTRSRRYGTTDPTLAPESSRPR